MTDQLSASKMSKLLEKMEGLQGFNGRRFTDEETAAIISTPVLWPLNEQLELVQYSEKMSDGTVAGSVRRGAHILQSDVAKRRFIVRVTDNGQEVGNLNYRSAQEIAEAGWRIK